MKILIGLAMLMAMVSSSHLLADRFPNESGDPERCYSNQECGDGEYCKITIYPDPDYPTLPGFPEGICVPEEE